ncbi:hypothetical protein MANES_S042516v8 [Manihot esculenta]|uniref:Uncharacterized protein n=1 Tax=Manihot esculenta TaxID=3983 RepID=A0ACB7FV51_MANES|nr:hypothetical protein MANES_S042516v8 [Manihot esculenta]
MEILAQQNPEAQCITWKLAHRHEHNTQIMPHRSLAQASN